MRSLRENLIKLSIVLSNAAYVFMTSCELEHALLLNQRCDLAEISVRLYALLELSILKLHCLQLCVYVI